MCMGISLLVLAWTMKGLLSAIGLYYWLFSLLHDLKICPNVPQPLSQKIVCIVFEVLLLLVIPLWWEIRILLYSLDFIKRQLKRTVRRLEPPSLLFTNVENVYRRMGSEFCFPNPLCMPFLGYLLCGITAWHIYVCLYY